MSKAIQIRDVPDDVHRKLKIRAAQQGRTLSEMLRLELEALANQASLDELFERISARGPVDLPMSAAELVRAGRAERC